MINPLHSHIVHVPSARGKVPLVVRAQRQAREAAPRSALFTPAVQEALAPWSIAIDHLEAISTELTDLHLQLVAKQHALHDARNASQAAGVQYAKVVEATCHGDPAAVASLGLQARVKTPPRPRPLLAPTGLSVEAARKPGSVTVLWNRTVRAQGYLLEYSLDPATDATWKPVPGTARRRMIVRDLLVGSRMVFRVAAHGAGVQSPFSAAVAFTVR